MDRYHDNGVGKSRKAYLKLKAALFCHPEVLEEWQCYSFEGIHGQVHVVICDPRQGQVERGLAERCHKEKGRQASSEEKWTGIAMSQEIQGQSAGTENIMRKTRLVL